MVQASRAIGYYLYTPNENYNGQDSFEFSVSDEGEPVYGTASITIVPINDAPGFDLDSSLTSAIEGEDYLFELEVFDIDNDSSTLIINSLYLPDGLYLENNNILGTPTISLSEDLNVEITLSVSDEELTTIENFTLTIVAVNNPPVSF